MTQKRTAHDELLASYDTTVLNHASTLEPVLRNRGILDGVRSLLSLGIGAGHLECQLVRQTGISFSYVERSEPMIAAVEANIAAHEIESRVLKRYHDSFETAPIDGEYDLVLSLDSWYHIACDRKELDKALRLRALGGHLLIQLMSADRQLYWELDRVRGLISSNDLHGWATEEGIEHEYFEHSHWTPLSKLIVDGMPTTGFKHFVAFAKGIIWEELGESEREESIRVAEVLEVEGRLETRHGYLVFTRREG